MQIKDDITWRQGTLMVLLCGVMLLLAIGTIALAILVAGKVAAAYGSDWTGVLAAICVLAMLAAALTRGFWFIQGSGYLPSFGSEEPGPWPDRQ